VHDSLDTLVPDFLAAFGNVRPAADLRAFLQDWKNLVPDSSRPVNLIRDFYNLLSFLHVTELDPDDPLFSARLGALARFSNILADFENVTRRGRWVEKDGARQFTGGTDRGEMYFQRLANFVLHYARDAYEDFDGEEAPDLDAVDILTVHQAKGLEWPVVFLPSLVDRRFPSSQAGKSRDWILPESLLSAATRRRYEGGEDDERRLFYVAITRARDVLYLSHFRRQKNRATMSRFLADLFPTNPLPDLDALPLPAAPEHARDEERPKISVSFSDLSDFDECGYRFRLSSSFGFETQLVPELGYGRAIHHVLRHVAENARATGSIPTQAEIEALLDREFYLPFANRVNFPNLRLMAARLIDRYVTRHQDDLHRIWATERPFELFLEDGSLSGRADVILDRHEGRPDALAIVDYKTTKGHERDELFAFQLAVYTAAGRAEGLNVEAAYLHHLEESVRSPIDVGASETAKAITKVNGLVEGLRQRRFPAKPEPKKCTPCEYRRLCRHSPADPWDEV
jgi:DNA helicase-2/ATP-dependent DNA helicase PcrA